MGRRSQASLSLQRTLVDVGSGLQAEGFFLTSSFRLACSDNSRTSLSDASRNASMSAIAFAEASVAALAASSRAPASIASIFPRNAALLSTTSFLTRSSLQSKSHGISGTGRSLGKYQVRRFVASRNRARELAIYQEPRSAKTGLPYW